MTRICRLVVFVFAVVCAANAYALTGRVVRLRGVELESQLTLPWRISVETAMQVARGRTLGAHGVVCQRQSVRTDRAGRARLPVD